MCYLQLILKLWILSFRANSFDHPVHWSHYNKKRNWDVDYKWHETNSIQGYTFCNTALKITTYLPFWRIFCTFDPMFWLRRLNSVSKLAECWYVEEPSMMHSNLYTFSLITHINSFMHKYKYMWLRPLSAPNKWLKCK